MDRHSDGAVAMAIMVATSEVGREEKKCISSYEIRMISSSVELHQQRVSGVRYVVCARR